MEENPYQPPVVVEPVRGGYWRIGGLVLVFFGLVVDARVAWLVAFYRQGFGEAEWNRSVVLFSAGVVTIVVGLVILLSMRTGSKAGPPT